MNLDESFLRAIAAAQKLEAKNRPIVPLGGQGSRATVEDGRIVIHSHYVDDYGCETELRFPTKIRLHSSGLNSDMFPVKADYDSGRQQWHIITPGSGYDRRSIYFERDMVPKEGELRRVLLPANLLADTVIGRRWRTVEREVEERGGRIMTALWQRGPVTKAVKTAFTLWAEAILSGRDGYEDDALWDELGAHKDPKVREAADRLFNATRGAPMRRFSTSSTGKSHGNSFVGTKKDLVVLYGTKSPLRGAHVPSIVVGSLPDIDFCNPPRR